VRGLGWCPVNDRAIDAIAEIFTWVGFGGALLLAIVAIVVRIADGSWVPAQAVLSDESEGRIARWFGSEGRVGQTWLTPEQEHELEGRATADVFVRLGRHDRLRLTKGSPLVRFLLWLTAGFAGLGVVAAVASIVLLAMR